MDTIGTTNINVKNVPLDLWRAFIQMATVNRRSASKELICQMELAVERHAAHTRVYGQTEEETPDGQR